MKIFLLTALVILLLAIIFFFVPVWRKQGKGGNTYYVDTWTKIQLMRGDIFID